MSQYKVANESGVMLEGPDETVHPLGTVLELDPENQQVKDLLENGTLELVPAVEEETVPEDETAPEVEETEPVVEDEETEEEVEETPSDTVAPGERHPLA